ncbi:MULTISPECIES: hypothetical protein [Clostridium]|uniref:hypothetical protein n=1 Tax=Clostridium TaxID=1485 RepID=UPI0003F8D527|nr:hypothetical protein [Clostridium cadaveris]MDU4952306.1 hypothetical protein [Clostridium sp.]MDY4948184.1 hypothetical protein [Clostridium cadaveris]NME65230.1 hypothetical protein [Clostridium cadaveris]NWK10585.1 hypothetical protein [Clostridium cadaveris]
MDNNFTNALKLAEKLKVHLKIATSMKSFDTYNSFYNIYTESDEPCRRIAVLTPYEELEEVYDESPEKAVEDVLMIDGNVWLKEYPLTTNPKNIDLSEIYVRENRVKEIEKYFQK